MSDPYQQPKQPLSHAQLEKEYFLERAREQARADRRVFLSAPVRSIIRALRKA